MFAFEHFGVVPDAVSFGKSMGGGMPISAVVGRRELPDVAPAIKMYTIAGNHVACAAAMANLDEIERLGLVSQSGRVGSYLLNKLNELQERHALIGDVRGLGMMLGLETVRDRGTKEPADREMAKIVMRAFELGLVVFYGNNYSNVMQISPPLIMTRPGSPSDRGRKNRRARRRSRRAAGAGDATFARLCPVTPPSQLRVHDRVLARGGTLGFWHAARGHARGARTRRADCRLGLLWGSIFGELSWPAWWRAWRWRPAPRVAELTSDLGCLRRTG
jgi:Aminotransferase class-III